MRFNLFSVVAISATLMLAACSIGNHLVYRPTINQGNYLVDDAIKQLKQGMSKEQVIYLLGSPMLKDPFDDNSWVYITRQQFNNETVKQHTLTLHFNNDNELITINNENNTNPSSSF